jgi:hypothetical protein
MIGRVIEKLKRDGLSSFLAAVAKYPFGGELRRKQKLILTKETISDRFNYIYDNHLWPSAESVSGSGSEVTYTEPLREWLLVNLPKLEIKRFVDAPCGDFNWMKFVVPAVDINYIGLDIVTSLIDANNKRYAKSSINFEVANICEDKLPSCDLIMVRDCLIHLSFEDIEKVLKNLSRTDYKYLLTTSHIVDAGFKNKNIITGEYRLIDIFSAPFNFEENHIVERLLDYPKGYPIPREMVLVEKKNVPSSLSFN